MNKVIHFGNLVAFTHSVFQARFDQRLSFYIKVEECDGFRPFFHEFMKTAKIYPVYLGKAVVGKTLFHRFKKNALFSRLCRTDFCFLIT